MGAQANVVVLLVLLSASCHQQAVTAAPALVFTPFSANHSSNSTQGNISDVPGSQSTAPFLGDTAAAALQDTFTDLQFAIAGALSHLASIALPVGEDDNRLDKVLDRHQPLVPRRRRSSRRINRRSQRRHGSGPVLGAFTNAIGPGTRGNAPPSPSAPPPAPYPGRCTQLASVLLDGVASGLRRSLVFSLQEGKLDFGLVGDSTNETDACGPDGCAFSNPSSPYGLTILPLAPEEDLDSKLRSNSTPSYIVHNLEGDTYGGRGLSPVWQLRQDEVVLVAGCTPMQEASRYFGATPYIYSAYNATRGSWVSLFASMGDSASVVRGPDITRHPSPSSSAANTTCSEAASSGSSSSSYGSGGAHAPINRLHATQLGAAAGINTNVSLFDWSSLLTALSSRSSTMAPLDTTAASRAVTTSMPGVIGLAGPEQQQQRQATENTAGAQPPNTPQPTSAMAGAAGSTPHTTPQQNPSESNQCSGSSSVFDAFTVFVMGANPAAVALAADAARAGAQRAAALVGLTADTPFINILPIPGPAFGEAIGLQPTDSYYMLMLRNIVPHGALDMFKSYAGAALLRAWRATPLRRLPAPAPAGSSNTSSGAGVGNDSSASTSSTGGSMGSDNGSRTVGQNRSTGGSNSSTTTIGSSGSSDGTQGTRTSGIAQGADTGNTEQLTDGSTSGLLGQLMDAAVMGSTGQQYLFPAASVIPRSAAVKVLAASSVSELAQTATSAGAAVMDAAADTAAAQVAAGRAVGTAIAAAWKAYGLLTEAGVAAAAGPVEQVSGSTILQGDLYLQPALDFLIGRLTRSFAGNYSIAHSIGSASALGTLGIDWGLDCVQRGVDFCNGDNRDTNYITSYPLVTLDRAGQMLVLVGANHAASGMATYLNVALADPISRAGVTAFEDTELQGSTRQWLAGTPYQWAASQLYAVVYSRSCAGVPMPCKEVPSKGPRSVPLPRPMLVISRPYVNPHTGVGPADADLTMMRTMLLTPAALATRALTRPRYDEAIFAGGYGCVQSLAGHTQCVPGGSPDVCCGAVRLWNTDACWCSQAGEVLLGTMPALLAPALLRELARQCHVPVNATCSAN